MLLRTSRTRLVVACCLTLAGCAHPRPRTVADTPLFQVETRDSTGLPLPNVTIETFTYVGAPFWDWVVIEPWVLPEGTHLLRFSSPGHRASTFSVLLREGRRVSLRVTLHREHEASPPSTTVDADEVDATGIAVEGPIHTDVVGVRRVIGRAEIERADAHTVRELLARSMESNGGVISPQTFARCAVMINGDRRRVLSFAAFDQMFAPEDAELFEVVARGESYFVPSERARRTAVGCGTLLAWLRKP